jgi:glucose-6-phosphate-specific signal transduction histidine kinase
LDIGEDLAAVAYNDREDLTGLCFCKKTRCLWTVSSHLDNRQSVPCLAVARALRLAPGLELAELINCLLVLQTAVSLVCGRNGSEEAT